MSHLIIESNILQEADIVKMGPSKAVFRMVAQTYDEVNQNKRMYPENVLKEAMKNCNDRMQKRMMTGELDHPLLTGSEQIDGVRQTTVLLKEASHLFRTYDWSGNRLILELETLTTYNGQQFFSLLRDKVTVGLSMRGMAELDVKNNIKIVKSPLYIVTFDAVSNPSHKSAVVDFSEMKFESAHNLTESCGVICTADGKCFLPEYLDKLIETKMIKFCDRWI